MFGFVSFGERREGGVGIVRSERQALLQIPPEVAGLISCILLSCPLILPNLWLPCSSPLTGSQPLPHFRNCQQDEELSALSAGRPVGRGDVGGPRRWWQLCSAPPAQTASPAQTGRVVEESSRVYFPHSPKLNRPPEELGKETSRKITSQQDLQGK